MSSKHHRGNRCEVSIFDEVKDIEDVVETESEVEIKIVYSIINPQPFPLELNKNEL